MDTPTVDFKKLAREQFKKGFEGNHYAVVKRNPVLIQELLKRIRDAGASGETISYGQWVQGLELIDSWGERLGLTPPWEGEVERGMNRILKGIALATLADYGFMATALIVNESGEYKGYPSEQFSVVWLDLLGSNYDPNVFRKVVPAEHRALADKHKKKVFEHCMAKAQPLTQGA